MSISAGQSVCPTLGVKGAAEGKEHWNGGTNTGFAFTPREGSSSAWRELLVNAQNSNPHPNEMLHTRPRIHAHTPRHTARRGVHFFFLSLSMSTNISDVNSSRDMLQLKSFPLSNLPMNGATFSLHFQ